MPRKKKKVTKKATTNKAPATGKRRGRPPKNPPVVAPGAPETPPEAEPTTTAIVQVEDPSVAPEKPVKSKGRSRKTKDKTPNLPDDYIEVTAMLRPTAYQRLVSTLELENSNVGEPLTLEQHAGMVIEVGLNQIEGEAALDNPLSEIRKQVEAENPAPPKRRKKNKPLSPEEEEWSLDHDPEFLEAFEQQLRA